MSMTQALDQLWTTILDFMSIFVMPDWGAIIGYLPIIIFFTVVAPSPPILLRTTTVPPEAIGSSCPSALASPLKAAGASGR